MGDRIPVIDDYGHVLGWCRAVHESVDTPRVILHEWEPNMAEEVEYRIVDPDTNNGRYEMRRWVRGVTEWRLDG